MLVSYLSKVSKQEWLKKRGLDSIWLQLTDNFIVENRGRLFVQADEYSIIGRSGSPWHCCFLTKYKRSICEKKNILLPRLFQWIKSNRSFPNGELVLFVYLLLAADHSSALEHYKVSTILRNSFDRLNAQCYSVFNRPIEHNDGDFGNCGFRPWQAQPQLKT